MHVRSTDIVAVELNHRFVISTPVFVSSVSSDQYAEVELRIQGQLTPLKPMDCNPAATGYGLQFFMPQLDGSDLGAMRECWSAPHGKMQNTAFGVICLTV
jgi:hypothetical protein